MTGYKKTELIKKCQALLLRGEHWNKKKNEGKTPSLKGYSYTFRSVAEETLLDEGLEPMKNSNQREGGRWYKNKKELRKRWEISLENENGPKFLGPLYS